jgi:squalene synthase HpnC
MQADAMTLTEAVDATDPIPADAVPEAARLAFVPATDVAAAEAMTHRLATTHYENFPVISVLLPKHLRQDFCNVYAFCRTADDLGDEVGDPQLSLRYLSDLRRQTLEAHAGQGETALFVALSGTIHRHDIPVRPFLDLIDAFEQDQRITRYDDFEQVVDYCRRSADPVGRLVLYLCDYRDERRQVLSDKICTALQLANFWQDVRRDLTDRDRIYLPADSMARFDVTVDSIREGIQQGRADDNFRRMLKFEVERTEAMFAEGEALLPMLRPEVRRHIGLFGQGGRAILEAIRRQDYDTLARRPTLSRWQKGRLIAGAAAALAARLTGPIAGLTGRIFS